MPLFRLYQSGEPTAVGVIVAKNKAVAEVISTETRHRGLTSIRVIV